MPQKKTSMWFLETQSFITTSPSSQIQHLFLILIFGFIPEQWTTYLPTYLQFFGSKLCHSPLNSNILPSEFKVGRCPTFIFFLMKGYDYKTTIFLLIHIVITVVWSGLSHSYPSVVVMYVSEHMSFVLLSCVAKLTLVSFMSWSCLALFCLRLQCFTSFIFDFAPLFPVC